MSRAQGRSRTSGVDVCWEVLQTDFGGWDLGRRGLSQGATLPPVPCPYRSLGEWENELEDGHEEKEEEESVNVPEMSGAPRPERESK